MSLEASLGYDEKLIFRDGLEKNHYPYPYTFAVTDRAVFVTKEKHFARESYALQRIPLTDVRQVSLVRQKPWSILTVSGLIFLFALTLIFFMMLPHWNGEPEAMSSSFPFLLAILALLMPFLAKNRRILIVETTGEVYKWKPKLIVNAKHNVWNFWRSVNCSEGRSRVLTLQKDFLQACRKVGLNVSEDRNLMNNL